MDFYVTSKANLASGTSSSQFPVFPEAGCEQSKDFIGLEDKLVLFAPAKGDAGEQKTCNLLAPPTFGSISVPKIIVEVMPKADLLDPAGKAVANALQRKGNAEITNVRIGKRIELHYEATPTEKDIEAAKQIAADFLSNGVIEDVVAVTVEN